MRNEDSTIKQQIPSFWDILRIFWSQERVDAWYSAIFPFGMEVCHNLICLAPHAHVYWERAYFALKPIRISYDKKRLDIQFFWLSSYPYVPGVNILQAPSLSASDQGPNSTKLFSNDTDTKIHSGCEISLETDDPVSRPLPDFRLLEMQWFLHRVTAISGAAEHQDNYHDDNDSNDDIAKALQNWRDMYTEDNWNMDIEEGPATYLEGHFPAQFTGIQRSGHMTILRGGEGSREGEDRGEDHKEF
ncbi:hypothetical protein CC78DRAFT_520953 [Lojkania enalia]|uniref:HNH nuclease domain-containing protein n=1 Tax=Lojkania enalia TaxID=147567 RepID=A0A9P4K8I4_9PLEO|nr:hypothetical protein CC78DRAFT_520953 [Didymosphaeria enalia]